MRIGIVLLVATCLTAVQLSQAESTTAPPAKDITGWYYWELPNAPLQFLLKFSRDTRGRLQVTSDNLARGDNNRPVSALFYNPPNFLIELDMMGSIKGRLTEDASKLDVVYQQGDFVIPFTFDRVDPSRFPPEPELLFTPGSSESARLCGFWNGTLDWKGVKLRHVLRLGRAADGRVMGKIDMLEQGERNIPFTTILVTNMAVRLESKPWSINYVGQLTQDSTKLLMEFSSGTKTAPITFERAPEPWQIVPSSPEPRSGAANLSSLEGNWEGIMDMQSVCSRVELRIDRSSDGRYQVVQYWPDDPRGIPNPAIVVDFKQAQLTCEWIAADFSRSVLQARFDSDRNRLAGVFESWGMLCPVSLHRVVDSPRASLDSR